MIYENDGDKNFPFTGKDCMSGYKSFSVQSNGDVHDCTYDILHRKVIGNINKKRP